MNFQSLSFPKSLSVSLMVMFCWKQHSEGSSVMNKLLPNSKKPVLRTQSHLTTHFKASTSPAFSFPWLLINKIMLLLSVALVKCCTCYLCKENANELILFSFTYMKIKPSFSVEAASDFQFVDEVNQISFFIIFNLNFSSAEFSNNKATKLLG